MWDYSCITRKEFEAVKDKIEEFIVLIGGLKILVDLPYEQGTTSIYEGKVTVNISTRPVFKYNELYYRVAEVCFSKKPFIVIECGTYEELMNNIMDDMDPFPYDLSDAELLDEVKYSLGIKPYPEN